MTDPARSFNEARERVLSLDNEHGPQLGQRRLWIRDLYGRITLIVGKRASDEVLGTASQLLTKALGPYAADIPVQVADDVFAAEQLFEMPGKEPVADDGSSFFLERYVTGADWLGGPLRNEPPTPPRVVLFGLKGGVGRSTALTVWARHLAESGRRVLVVDLDLEAPGLGSLLLRPDDRPRFGLVDWFVESAIGEGDWVVTELVTTSALGRDTDGAILVAPAAGRDDDGYVRKLNRVYLDVPGADGPVRFADRLGALVDALEAEAKPDVVLIDSRAGLQDAAAVALSRLGGLNLLFAVDTPQTWDGYRHLFSHWKTLHRLDRERFDDLRGRIQIVASQVPEIDANEYMERFRSNSYNLFLTSLYDQTDIGAEEAGHELFAYDIGSSDAPHQPIRINWSRAFQDYDPQTRPEAVSPEQLHAAFGGFLERATELLLAPLDPA